MAFVYTVNSSTSSSVISKLCKTDYYSVEKKYREAEQMN